MAGWNSLSKQEQTKARRIRDWASSQGAPETVSQIAKNWDLWEDAYDRGELPAGYGSQEMSVKDR